VNREDVSWNDIVNVAMGELVSRGLDGVYKERLKFELAEVEKQAAEMVWVNRYRDNSKFASNPNNLLLPWFLEMVVDDPIASRNHPMLNTVRASKVSAFKETNGYIPHDLIKDSDSPDIDIDCLPAARDPIKQYAIERYGKDFNDGYGSVCSVGTWQTYKFKQALIDAAIALGFISGFRGQGGKGKVAAEVPMGGLMNRYQFEKEFTTVLPDEVDGLKDGGKAVCRGKIRNDKGEEKDCGNSYSGVVCEKCGSTETDGPTIGQLLQENPILQNLVKRFPADKVISKSTGEEIDRPALIDAAVELIGRVRNMGMHAGAIIITDRPLYGNVPLARSSRKGFWVSMWTEGRNTQLSKFGYVKWDWLGLKTLEYIFRCCQLIEENRGISFGPNMSGWDDIDPIQRRAGHFFDNNGNKYDINLDDPYVLKLANEQKTDGVFQFDTDLAKTILANGVRTFEDLMLFNAMGHPGPMASIPEAVKNRDDIKGTWKKKLDPEFLKVLESTYGTICFQEDSLISLSDGRHLPIRDVKDGMLVHSPNLKTGVVDIKKVECCGPTQFGDGVRVVLDNGYSLIITDQHKLCLWGDERKIAAYLKPGDLVAVPLVLKHPPPSDEFVPYRIARWLGPDRDVAYLLGQSVGDLAASGTGSSLCVGSERDCDIIINWMSLHLPKLRTHKYFHCRSWYIQISSIEKSPIIDIILPPFVDDREWWARAYDLASGVEISRIIKRSTWFVYDRLNNYDLLRQRRPKNRTTAWQDLLRSVGLKTTLWLKRIPEAILIADLEVQAAYLAGMIDSDGTISLNKRGYDICHYTSESPLLIQDLCHLLQLLGLAHTSYRNRVFIWDIRKLKGLIQHFLLIKNFRGKSLNGNGLGWVPKSVILQSIIGVSKREADRLGVVSRSTLRYRCNLVRTQTALKAGVELGDFRYYRVRKVEIIKNQQFYNLSVEGNHTVVANGIASHQCYQEQLQALWQNIAGFTSPEAQEARKAVAKKWTHKLKPIEKKWIVGASHKIGRSSAEEWWTKMVTFGRYAFNRCLAAGTVVQDIDGHTTTIENARGLVLESSCGPDVVVDVHFNGYEPVYKVTFSNGVTECVTMGHRYLTDAGMVELSELSSSHAIKYISGGVINGKTAKVNRTRRIKYCSLVSKRGIVQDHNSSIESKSNIESDNCSSNRQILCEKEFSDKKSEMQGSLLSGRFDTASMLLGGVLDGRWICKRQERNSSATAGMGKESRFGLSVCGIFRLSKCSQGEEKEEESDFLRGKIRNLKCEIDQEIERIWSHSEKIIERDTSTPAIYGGFHKGIYGWRWDGCDKCERLPDGWIRFEFGLSHGFEESTCTNNSKFELQQTITRQEYCELRQVNLDWLRSMQSDSQLDASTQGPIYEEKACYSRIYIKSIEYVGVRPVYSPEMLSKTHDYSIAPSHPIAANSHAVSYCLVAHRCLWLKAHFAPEFWAAVMSDCHPDKLVRYMGVARAEAWEPTPITYCGRYKGNGAIKGVHFGPMNIENLTADFTVTGDVVNQGLIGIKGVGDKAAKDFQGKGKYTNIDEFVQSGKGRQSKPIIERFIKLGAFRHMPGHENSYALWKWYQYRYCKSGTEMTQLRADIRQQLLEQDGWNQQTIQTEIARQVSEYKKLYPKRNKIPPKIINWKPKPVDTRERVMGLYLNDFSMEECLGFQKEFLGYWIDSPLDVYQCSGNCTIANAKETARRGNTVILEGIITNAEMGTTKKNAPYLKVFITDGVQRGLVFVWSNELNYQDFDVIKENVGVSMVVDYDDKRGTFCLARNEVVQKLMPRGYKGGGHFEGS
jgi:intein/homing endonuclease